MENKITFDRFARWTVTAVGILVLFLIINHLSGVLLPFFVALLLAYLLYPLVHFVQYRMHVKNRAISIVIAIIFVVAVLGGVLYLIIPPMVEQFEKLFSLVSTYLYSSANDGRSLVTVISEWIQVHQDEIKNFFESKEFADTMKDLAPKLFNVVGQTASVVISVVASFITLLYMFFILLDYEDLGKGFVNMFPPKKRSFAQELMGDVKTELNNYVRGQGTVALIMGILFCIGLTIIDFPMAIGLGILIGILDLVPYLHGLALIPMTFLALLKAADTGQNFWIIIGSVLLVFVAVQAIIDLIVTPKVMGKAMRLNPAVLLLALSVWGFLLGFIGLIIALPLTTLIISYYKRYIIVEK